MKINWIDIFFLIIIGFAVLKGWSRGFVYLVVTLITVVVSLFVAVKTMIPLSVLLEVIFKIPQGMANIIAFFGVGFVTQLLVSFLLSRVIMRNTNNLNTSKMNRFLGSIISGFSGTFVLSSIVFYVLIIPLQSSLKQAISQSSIAPMFIKLIDTYGGPLPKILSNSAANMTVFLTIQPDSDERIELTIPSNVEMVIDEEAEEKMIEMINNERQTAGVKPLKTSFSMREVGRSYSQQMIQQHYFAHKDDEGKDIARRLNQAGVNYIFAGENLAYAPDLLTAHQGLMNSLAHKRNILDPQFTRVGIGIVDLGRWGIMVTQVFGD